MASSDQDTPTNFAYQAQTHEGQPLSGVIDAPDVDTAGRLLESLRLRVLEIETAAVLTKPRSLRRRIFSKRDLRPCCPDRFGSLKPMPIGCCPSRSCPRRVNLWCASVLTPRSADGTEHRQSRSNVPGMTII